MDTNLSSKNQIHEILSTISVHWSKREWGGISWTQQEWYTHSKNNLPTLIHYCQPWSPQVSHVSLDDLLPYHSIFIQSMTDHTLRWICILAHYQASAQGLLNKFLDDVSLYPQLERAWQQCTRRSLSTEVIQHAHRYAQHLSQDAQNCIYPLLELWLQLPICLHQEEHLTRSQRTSILHTLYTNYCFFFDQSSFPSKADTLTHSSYGLLWDACTFALQAQWAEAHLALAQCEALDERVKNQYQKALEGIRTAIRHGIGHLEKFHTQEQEDLVAKHSDKISTIPSLSSPSESLMSVQTPLPQAGSVVGYHEWRLEGLMSDLSSCRTWRARRRKGSIYKKAAVKWSKLSSDPVVDHRLIENLVIEKDQELTIVELDEKLHQSLMARGKAFQSSHLHQFVNIIEFGWDPVRERLCIVEDLLEGPSLYEAHRHKPLTVKQLLALGKELMTGLMYLHHQNLFHGNIKPENIVWHRGAWYWTDAHLLLDHLAGGGQEARKRSKLFQAPENIPSPTADLFALGKVLEELLVASQDTEVEHYAFLKYLIAKLTHPTPKHRGIADTYVNTWGHMPTDMKIRLTDTQEILSIYPHQLEDLVLRDLPCYTLEDLIASPLQQTYTSRLEVQMGAEWKDFFHHEPICRQLHQIMRRKARPLSELFDALYNAQAHTKIYPLSHWYIPSTDSDQVAQMTFILIPKGFNTLHEDYKLETAILMSTTPITLGSWKSYMGDKQGVGSEDQTPVESVHFIDAQNFCYTLQTQLQTSYPQAELKVRLPTLHEWVYTALAGQHGAYAGDQTAHESVCSLETSQGELSKVSQFKANAWGLYDMSGLVWEWVLSYPSQPKYIQKPELVFKNQVDKTRMICGGSWIDSASMCSVLQHKTRLQSSASFDQGFRIILQLQ